MKPRVSAELARWVAAVEILSSTTLRVGDRIVEVGGPAPLFAPSPPDPEAIRSPREALQRALADELYCQFYTRAATLSPPAPDLGAHRDLLVALERANSCSGFWQPGWRVRGIADNGGRVAVEGFDLVFLVTPEEVRAEGGQLAAGASCRVRVPGEMRNLRPGFYAATGDADPAAPAELPWLVRLYWHLRPCAAPLWVETLTRELNRQEIPFRLKVVADPRFYLRADAGVLFLEPEHCRAARPILRKTYRAVRAHLRSTVPGLTRELAPGLGVAEGAADGTSFGGARAELVAAALVGLDGQASRPADSLDAVVAAFRAAGLDPLHPYRAAGSKSRYSLLARSDLLPPPPTTPARRSIVPRESDLAAAAVRIGDALCRSALHGEGRCNWIGRDIAPDPLASGADPGGGFIPAVGALGANLYRGTAGIALFLAQLYSRTLDPAHQGTSRAAIRQALGAVVREPARYRPVGFFEGRLGIAWVARRVAALTGDEKLADEAEALVSAIARSLPGERRWDVLEGNAGAILAFLRLHEETGSRDLLEAASRLGQELLPAVPGPVVAGGEPPLTGFAHGAAGIGLALLELATVTGDVGLREASERCFAYEEACFDPERGNWPDLRTAATRAPGGSAACMTAWCHGAPGIALSRLRAIEIDPQRLSCYEPAARAGLRTTATCLERCLLEPATEACLCHGTAGLADVALLGGRLFEEPALESLAYRAMAGLAAIHPSRSGDPSLLTGDAGIGYALLRFDDPASVPTVLLPAAHANAGCGHIRLETTAR